MLIEHLKENWINHMAAGSGTLFSLLNGAAILQSIIVGVAIYVITHALAAGSKLLWSKRLRLHGVPKYKG